MAATISRTRAYVLLFLISILWGSYPATAKMALVALPPFILVTIRCWLASGFLTVLLARRGYEEARALGWSDLRPLAFLGFVGLFISSGFTYLAIYTTTASNAAILQAASPVMVAVGARLYLKERLRRIQQAGVLCSALGVLLVVTKGGWAALSPANLHAGDFIALFALAGWSVFTIYGKRVLAIYSPAVVTTASYLLGSLMLLPFAIATAPLFPPPRFTSPVAWSVVLYHAFLGAIAHVWWYEGVRAVGPTVSAIFMNFQPLVGVVLAALLVGETITWVQVVGGLAIVGGAALTTRLR